MKLRADTLQGQAQLLAARHSAAMHQLDMLLDRRGPVTEVRRLVADLDRIAEDLAASLREAPPKPPTPGSSPR
jgi:hypothetical protein